MELRKYLDNPTMTQQRAPEDQPTERTALISGYVSDPDPAVTSDAIVPAKVNPSDDICQDGGDLERQTSNGEIFKNEGDLEVRKRMRYIFPAIAIGVSIPDPIIRVPITR